MIELGCGFQYAKRGFTGRPCTIDHHVCFCDEVVHGFMIVHVDPSKATGFRHEFVIYSDGCCEAATNNVNRLKDLLNSVTGWGLGMSAWQ